MPSIADPTIIRLAGAAGSLIIIVASLLAGLVYRGKEGQRYSPLNHFISELGEVGVSRLAWLFNAGLITGGLLVLVFVVGLSLYLPGWLKWLALAAGVLAAVMLTLVGVFPMNKLEAHSFVATTYFRSGLAMLIFFTLAILLQPAGVLVMPRAIALFGLPAIAAYASFLYLTRPKSSAEPGEGAVEAEETPVKKPRPSFWLIAAVEWSIFFTTVLWFGAVGLVL